MSSELPDARPDDCCPTTGRSLLRREDDDDDDGRRKHNRMTYDIHQVPFHHHIRATNDITTHLLSVENCFSLSLPSNDIYDDTSCNDDDVDNTVRDGTSFTSCYGK